MKIVEPKNAKKRKLSNNIFALSLHNDQYIEDFLNEEKSDSSGEEDNREDQEEQRITLNTQKFIDESQNYPFSQDGNENLNFSNKKKTLEDKETSQIDINNKDFNTKKSFIYRLFGPVDAGSIRGSIFNLSIFSLGSGCLALPQKISQMSVIVAIVDILLSGIATYWTLNLMVIASKRVKNCFNYPKVVEMLYGKKLSTFLSLTILIYTIGVIILYQVVAYKLIGAIINDLGGYGYKNMNDFVNKSFWSSYGYKFLVMYGIVNIILLPLCLLKDMNKLRFSSIFGVFSLLFVMIIIIIQTPSYLSDFLSKQKDDDPGLNIFDISKGFGDGLYFFKGSSTIFYSFNCHIAAFPILKGLNNNVNRRIQKVFRRSLILDVIVYFIIGICGYLTCPINTPDLIIERGKLGETDYLMTFGRFCFLCTLLMKLPASFLSFRITFLSLINYQNEEISNKLNYLITLPTLYFTCLVSILYQDISDYISLLGSFNAVIIGFILPGLIYIKSNNLPISHRKNVITILFIAILTLIGFSSGVITIIGMFNRKH